MMCKYAGLRRYSAYRCRTRVKIEVGLGKLGGRNEEPDNSKEEGGIVERRQRER
jgi:hypothetical protein